MFSRLSPARVLPDDPELQPFLPGLHFSFFNALTWQIAAGTPLVLLAEALGATAAQTGLAYSFIYLLTPVQVLATILVPRFGYKRLTLAGWGLRSFMLLVPLGLTVLAPRLGVQAWMVPALVASSFGFCLLRSIGVAASIPWFFAMLPPRFRGRYFGSDQLMSGLSSMLTLVTSSLLFYALGVYPALMLQYLIALTGSGLSYRSLRQLPDCPPPPRQSLLEIGRGLWRLAFTRSDYASYLWITVGCFVATTPLAPFVAYHLRADVGMSAQWVMGLELVRYTGAVLAALTLRRRIDVTGARPFLMVSFGLYALLSLWWALGLRAGAGGGAALVAAYLIMGLAGTCWSVGNLGYLPKLMSDDDRMLGLTLQGALASLLGGLATMVWGVLMKRRDGGAGLNETAFLVLFIVAGLSCVVLGLGLFKVKEPDAPSVDPLHPGEMLLRPHRALSYLVNLIGPK